MRHRQVKASPVTVTYADGRKEIRAPDSFGSPVKLPEPYVNPKWALLKYAEYLREGGDRRSGRGRTLRTHAAPTCTPVVLAMLEEVMDEKEPQPVKAEAQVKPVFASA